MKYFKFVLLSLGILVGGGLTMLFCLGMALGVYPVNDTLRALGVPLGLLLFCSMVAWDMGIEWRKKR